MKRIVALLGFFIALCEINGAEIKDLILQGTAFGNGWELTQATIIPEVGLPKGLKAGAAPVYTNRALTNHPTVSIYLLEFPSAQAAKEQFEKKFNTPDAKQHSKKLEGQPEAYEVTQEEFKFHKRYILIDNFWLTVDQIGNDDQRGVFIQKYTEHLQKNAKR